MIDRALSIPRIHGEISPAERLIIAANGIAALLGFFGAALLSEAGGMPSGRVTYRGCRFPAEIISYAVWLFHVFSLSPPEVEVILSEQGITVTHESIRQWCLRFGADFAAKLSRRRPKLGDIWHLDEVFLCINGVLHYLWRAIEQNGVVLHIFVQGRRNAGAAKRFFKRLLVGLKYKPKRVITDGRRAAASAVLFVHRKDRVSATVTGRHCQISRDKLTMPIGLADGLDILLGRVRPAVRHRWCSARSAPTGSRSWSGTAAAWC